MKALQAFLRVASTIMVFAGAVVVGAAPSMIVLADGVLLMLLGAAAAIGGFA